MTKFKLHFNVRLKFIYIRTISIMPFEKVEYVYKICILQEILNAFKIELQAVKEEILEGNILLSFNLV